MRLPAYLYICNIYLCMSQCYRHGKFFKQIQSYPVCRADIKCFWFRRNKSHGSLWKRKRRFNEISVTKKMISVMRHMSGWALLRCCCTHGMNRELGLPHAVMSVCPSAWTKITEHRTPASQLSAAISTSYTQHTIPRLRRDVYTGVHECAATASQRAHSQ